MAWRRRRRDRTRAVVPGSALRTRMQPKSSAALPPQIQLLFFNTFSRRTRCPQLWTSDHDPDPRTCPNPPVDRGCLSLSSAPAFDLALWPPTGALRALRNGVAQSPPRVLRGGPDNDFLLRLLVDREHLRPALHVRVWRSRSGFVCLRGREVSSGQREGDGKEQGMLFFFLKSGGGKWRRIPAERNHSSWASLEKPD